MGGGVSRHASMGPSPSPLIDEASRRDSGHKVAALSSAAPALESVPLLSADKQIWSPALTLDEAKASSYLKEALENVYYQPNPTLNSHEGCQISSVSGETRTVSTIPKHVSQMFSLLHRSSEVQAAVASIASDERVLEAVMKNDKVAEFCKNLPPNLHSATSVAENEFPNKESYPSLESEKTCESSMFSNMVNNLKVKVSEKVSNVSDFLQDFLVISSGNSSSMSANTTVRTAEAYHPDRASFFALAVAAILVVLFMRG